MASFAQTGKYVAVLLITLLVIFSYKKALQDGQQMEGGQNPTPSAALRNSLSATKTFSHRLNIPAVQCNALSASKKKIGFALDGIRTNWDIPSFPLFLTMMNIPLRSWDIQKLKFVEKIMTAHGQVVAVIPPLRTT